MQRSRKKQRGIALAVVGMMMFAFLALSVVAVDLGRLAHTATEAQNMADTAATAGAAALMEGRDSLDGAGAVASVNVLDGEGKSACRGSGCEVVIDDGYWSLAEGFVVGGVDGAVNAVRASVTEEVDNIVAGVFGSSSAQSTVRRMAIAAASPPGAGRPTLPVALGECYFNDPCFEQGCLPDMIQIPSNNDGSANNTAWTSFFVGNTNPNTVSQYIPSPCGGGVEGPDIQVGDDINLNNGQLTGPIFNALQCLVDNNMLDFTIPVIRSEGESCGGPLNQSEEVVGFARIHILEVNGQGNPKYIRVSSIFEDNAPGPPGGGCLGCGFVRVSMVR